MSLPGADSYTHWLLSLFSVFSEANTCWLYFWLHTHFSSRLPGHLTLASVPRHGATLSAAQGPCPLSSCDSAPQQPLLGLSDASPGPPLPPTNQWPYYVQSASILLCSSFLSVIPPPCIPTDPASPSLSPIFLPPSHTGPSTQKLR